MSGARVILFGSGSSDELDDASLVEALRRRDPRAELMAWRRLGPTVARTIRRLAGPGCDEEDLSQEVFLRFFRSIGGLREVAAMRGYRPPPTAASSPAPPAPQATSRSVARSLRTTPTRGRPDIAPGIFTISRNATKASMFRSTSQQASAPSRT